MITPVSLEHALVNLTWQLYYPVSGAEKYLVVSEYGREEPEILRNSKKLAQIDVVLFVYDSADTNSFRCALKQKGLSGPGMSRAKCGDAFAPATSPTCANSTTSTAYRRSSSEPKVI